MSAHPVSWKVVDRGWRVVASDGTEVGHIDEVTGDGDADIFNGIVVSRGTLRGRRYVPAEQVGEIVDGAVNITIDSETFESGEDYEEPPPSEQILAP